MVTTWAIVIVKKTMTCNDFFFYFDVSASVNTWHAPSPPGVSDAVSPPQQRASGPPSASAPPDASCAPQAVSHSTAVLVPPSPATAPPVQLHTQTKKTKYVQLLDCKCK